MTDESSSPQTDRSYRKSKTVTIKNTNVWCNVRRGPKKGRYVPTEDRLPLQ
jgi:hypothetical protein